MATRRGKQRLVNQPEYQRLTSEEKRERRKQHDIELFQYRNEPHDPFDAEDLMSDDSSHENLDDQVSNNMADDLQLNNTNNGVPSTVASSAESSLPANTNSVALTNPSNGQQLPASASSTGTPISSFIATHSQLPPNNQLPPNLPNLSNPTNPNGGTRLPLGDPPVNSQPNDMAEIRRLLAGLPLLQNTVSQLSVRVDSLQNGSANSVNSLSSNASALSQPNVPFAPIPPPPPQSILDQEMQDTLRWAKQFPLELPLDNSNVIRALDTWSTNLPPINDHTKMGIARASFNKWKHQAIVTDRFPDIMKKDYSHFRKCLQEALGRDHITTLTTTADRSLKELYEAAKTNTRGANWRETYNWLKQKLSLQHRTYLDASTSQEAFDARMDILIRIEAQEKMDAIFNKKKVNECDFSLSSTPQPAIVNDLIQQLQQMNSKYSTLENTLAAMQTEKLNEQSKKSNSNAVSSDKPKAAASESELLLKSIEKIHSEFRSLKSELTDKHASNCNAVDSRSSHYSNPPHGSQSQRNQFDPNICIFHSRYQNNARCCKGSPCPFFNDRVFQYYNAASGSWSTSNEMKDRFSRYSNHQPNNGNQQRYYNNQQYNQQPNQQYNRQSNQHSNPQQTHHQTNAVDTQQTQSQSSATTPASASNAPVIIYYAGGKPEDATALANAVKSATQNFA